MSKPDSESSGVGVAIAIAVVFVLVLGCVLVALVGGGMLFWMQLRSPPSQPPQVISLPPEPAPALPPPTGVPVTPADTASQPPPDKK